MSNNAMAQAIGQNYANRRAIVENCMPMMQPLQTQSIAGTVTTSNSVLTFQPRLTGLLLGFLVEVNATVNNAGAATANRTNGGAANVLSRIQFTDLQNQTRVNTNGYHLAMLNSIKNTRGYGGAVAPNLPFNVGNVFTVNSLASTIAQNATPALRQFFYVPIAYSPQDLTGAIYAQVINATMQLQLTINVAPGTASADSLFAIYTGATAAGSITLSAVSVTVTTFYYNQPTALPLVDISRSYLIQDTIANAAIVANQDISIPYSNFRTYFSTFAIYDNAGVFNTGSDVNYWALQYANLLRQFQLNPETVALLTRNAVGYDMPPGLYYFDHRSFPISTANYGNCELVLNAAAATSGAFVGTWYEMVAQENSIITASSLPSTGG